jgi:hypothetical protein
MLYKNINVMKIKERTRNCPKLKEIKKHCVMGHNEWKSRKILNLGFSLDTFIFI